MREILLIAFLWVAFSVAGQVLIKPSIHDFGHFSEQSEKVEAYFNLENISKDTVEIVSLTPSCGCAAAVVDTVIIAPNQSTRLLVIFEAKSRPGDFFNTIKVKLKSKAKIWYTHIAIKGYVIPQMTQIENKKTFINKITIDTFAVNFRHDLDTSAFELIEFNDLMNGLTYVLDKDGAVIIGVNVLAFNYDVNADFLLKKLKARIKNEMKKRGYPKENILFQSPEYNIVNNDGFLNAGSVRLIVLGYSGLTKEIYKIEKTVKENVPSEVLDEKFYLKVQNDTLKKIVPEWYENKIYKAVNAIHQDMILGKLNQVQVVLKAQIDSRKMQKLVDNWHDALLEEIENTMPESLMIPIADPKIVLSNHNEYFEVSIINVQKESDLDTIVFEETRKGINSKPMTSIPVFNLKTKSPGEGDLELYQKKRLFANLKAQHNTQDTLEIIAVMQHNGFLKDVDNQEVLDAVAHYKIVLESIQREAERQGFIVKTKFWIQPFHVTHWNRIEQTYLSIQFLSQFKTNISHDFEDEEFVGFYNSDDNDSVVVAGSQSFYLDKMAAAISKNGWLAIELYAYKYTDNELTEMKIVQKELIDLTKKTLQELRSELLKRGVDPTRLLITKEKIIVRNKPLDKVKGFGIHQPLNTISDRFTKVVFKKVLD